MIISGNTDTSFHIFDRVSLYSSDEYESDAVF